MRQIRILLVDDQASVREGLRMRLDLEPDMQVIGEAADGRAALERATSLEPDVLLMDYEMPEMNGLEAVNALAASGLVIPVVMLSIHDDELTRRKAGLAGVTAFVAKHEASEKLVAAIRGASRTDEADI